MAKYAITLSVDFFQAYDFDGAEKQLNEQLEELLGNIRFQTLFFGGEVNGARALKVSSNKEMN